MNKIKQEYRIGTGATSTLMIFIVLCLTTLSILSFVSAKADLAMSQRSAGMVIEYYAAAATAQEHIAALDGALKAAREAAADEAGYVESIKEIAVAGARAQSVDQAIRWSLTLETGYGGHLVVEIEATPFQETGDRYRVVRHALVASEEWDNETEIELATPDREEFDEEQE